MNAEALAGTAILRDELAANDEQPIADPRDLPVRFSYLKAMGRSAAHCRHSMEFDWEQTLSMRLGRGAHSLLLGGPVVLLCPTKMRKGKDYDLWRKDQPTDAIVLTTKEYAKAHGMNAAVRANPLASKVLYADGTIYEQTILWEQNGRKRRSTPDARTLSHLVDLKTTRDASLERFRWDAIKQGYHVQLADYESAMIAENGFAPKMVYIVAVEQKAPHMVSVHKLTVGALDRGRVQAATWLAQLLECERTGIWPGYSDTIVDFDVPLDVDVDLKWDDDEDDADTE